MILLVTALSIIKFICGLKLNHCLIILLLYIFKFIYVCEKDVYIYIDINAYGFMFILEKGILIK
jgi:hypothetical protein